MKNKKETLCQFFFGTAAYYAWRLKLRSVHLHCYSSDLKFQGRTKVFRDFSLMEFNLKYLTKCPVFLRYAVVFHELAHVKTMREQGHIETAEEAEYLAESQALIWFEKYYPKYYQQYIKRVRIILKRKMFGPEHQAAFSRIKVYQQ